MVAQVHNTYNLRNRTVNNVVGNANSYIFIKDVNHKMNDGNKGKYQSTNPRSQISAF